MWFLTKFGFSSNPLAIEPPVSPAAPTRRTLVRDMMIVEDGDDSWEGYCLIDRDNASRLVGGMLGG